MISVRKLQKLRPDLRLRKIGRLFADFERELLAGNGERVDRVAMHDVALLLATDEGADARVRRAASDFAQAQDAAVTNDVLVRLTGATRHAILAQTGTDAAEWDLLPQALTNASSTPKLPPAQFPITLFLEDVRSPFNVGSIIRTAAAFGVRNVLLSSGCASPDHPRTLRSAMGACELVEVGTMELDELAAKGRHILALEQGGCPLSEFRFPVEGIVIVGSEELGVSPSALAVAEAADGRVSIPLSGAKASLNVGVAVGILLNAWVTAMEKNGDLR